jgi:TonB family protein
MVQKTQSFMKVFYAISLLLFMACSVVAQTDPGWVRLQTKDGAFSVEMPAGYKYFYSKEGFSISRMSTNFQVSEMGMLTAYHEGTMLAVEVYNGSGGALNAMYERDKKRLWTEDSAIQIDDVEAKRLKFDDGDAAGEMRYLRHGKWILVILAASRNGRTPASERFLSSIKLRPKDAGPLPDAKAFSELKSEDVRIHTNIDDAKPSAATPPLAANPPADPTVKRFKLLRAPNPSYVDSARRSGARGNVRVRVHFGGDGFVPKIEVLDPLDQGLLRQALYAAIRFRYLPQEKDGKSVDISRPVTFNFNIY